MSRTAAGTYMLFRCTPFGMKELLAFLALALCGTSTKVDAQYADSDKCSRMAGIALPTSVSNVRNPDSTVQFEHEIGELNPRLPDEFAKQPFGRAYLVLAECYRNGVEVEKNRLLGNKLLHIAASKGSRPAKFRIATIDVFQSGNAARQKSGFEVLEKEFQRGSVYAAGIMGWAYQQGLGVEQDTQRALELYKYSAERGMTYWQYLLAHAFYNGYLELKASKERGDYWREMRPKLLDASYGCLVSKFYQVGIFPNSPNAMNEGNEDCDEAQFEDFWN